MTDPLTDARLAELDRLLAAATPGEWVPVIPPGRKCAAVRCVRADESFYIYLNVDPDMARETVDRWQADARFIAAAHASLPTLLAEVRRLREGADEVRLKAYEEGVAVGREERKDRKST